MNSRTPFCKPSLAAMIVSATLSLAACGGDDSEIYEVSENTNADSSPTGANTGKIVAPFVVGATSRGMLAGLGTFSSSNLAEGHRLVQAADGAITTIGAYSLADSVTVNEISGDATFALGRWSRGRMVGGSRDMLLDGQDARSYHYLAYNTLPATTTTAARACDAGTFTAATLWDSGTVPAGTKVGVTTGTAVLTWVPATATAAASATVKVSFTTTASGSVKSDSYDVSLSDFSSTTAVGRYFAQGPGVAIVLGDGGNGAVMIGALYRVLLPNNLTYEGIMKFHCA